MTLTELQDTTKTRQPIHAVKRGKYWMITGDTFLARRKIQASAPGKAVWDKLNKAWLIYKSELPAAISELVTTSGGSITGDNGAPEEAERFTPPAAEMPEPVNQDRLRFDGAPEVAPEGGVVKPVYWDRLTRYLNPLRPRPAIALVGPTGNGKTTVAEAILSALDYDYLVLDCNDSMEPADLIGCMSFVRREDGSAGEVWRDGPVTRAFREGKAVLLNEFDTLRARTAMCLQSVFQDAGMQGTGRYVTLSGNAEEDRVFPAGACPLILTMNTWGTGATAEFVGRNALDLASLDRISLITTDYENEEAILVARGFSKSTASSVVKWALKARKAVERNALKAFVSNRLLLRLCESVELDGLSLKDAVAEEFLDRFAPEDRDLLAVL